MEPIKPSFFKQAESKLKKTSPVIRNAIIRNGIKAVALNQDVINRQNYSFSNEIKTGKAQDQKMSGRCWMFAGLNILRQKVIKEKNMAEFELSQSFLQVFEKVEKANSFLERIIELKDKDLTDREMYMLLESPISEGAWWQTFANLIEKYGCVPKEIMPETFHSGNVNEVNNYLNTILRQFARDLRNEKSLVKIKELKEKQLEKIYEIVTQIFGQPPTSFEYSYKDSKDKFHATKKFTPKSFLKTFVKFNPSEYIVLSHVPIKGRKIYQPYENYFESTIIDKNKVKSLNVPFKDIEASALKQVKAGESMWFGCGVGIMSEYMSGILDENSLLYETVFNQEINLNKEESMEYHEPILTHAMTLTGVHIQNNKPIRWKVENSWGDTRGKEGYFVMSNVWFNNYCTTITLNKKYATKKMLDAWNKKSIQVKPWEFFS